MLTLWSVNSSWDDEPNLDAGNRLRPGRRQGRSGATAHGSGGLCALWGGCARRALYRPHAQPARTARTALAALGQTPAPVAVGWARAADSLAADRLGV